MNLYIFTDSERLRFLVRCVLNWTPVDVVRIRKRWIRDSQTFIQQEAVKSADGNNFSMPVVKYVPTSWGELVLG